MAKKLLEQLIEQEVGGADDGDATDAQNQGAGMPGGNANPSGDSGAGGTATSDPEVTNPTSDGKSPIGECNLCHAKVVENAAFCHGCGNKLREDDEGDPKGGQVECPECKTAVSPTSDGRCPNCGSELKANESVAEADDDDDEDDEDDEDQDDPDDDDDDDEKKESVHRRTVREMVDSVIEGADPSQIVREYAFGKKA